MKFKVGDKIKCVDRTDLHYIELGEVYTVQNVVGEYITLKEILRSHSYLDKWFELVSSPEVLTPEEVFEHLRNGTKLQISDCGWVDKDRYSATIREVIYCKWRIKPEPEIIELNGKKYREIVD